MCQTERVLTNHIERCAMHKAKTVKMPTPTGQNPENTVHFTAIEKQLPLPFWFVADFEAICEPHETVLPEFEAIREPHETVLPDVPAPDVPMLDPKTGKMRFSEHCNPDDVKKGKHAISSTVKTSKQTPSEVAYQLCSVDSR